MSVFLGLRSPLPDAVKRTEFVDRHGRVVAIKGELRSSGLRFDPSLSCGRAQWTRVAHEDLRFARGAHRDIGRSRTDLRAREASRAFGGGGTQGARLDINGLAVALGAGVRDLRSGTTTDLRDVVSKARREQKKATDAGGAPR